MHAVIQEYLPSPFLLRARRVLQEGITLPDMEEMGLVLSD